LAKKVPEDIKALFDKINKTDEVRDVRTVSPTSKSGKNQMRLGYPVTFAYDPKWKKTLPYYDNLPLSIVLAKYGDRFLGINLHYVPWARRIQLAEYLVRRTKNKNRVTYRDIKAAWKAAKLPLALASLCIRMYLHSHIKSKMKQFDWETYREAAKNIDPRFKKKADQYIYNQTMNSFRDQKKSTKK